MSIEHTQPINRSPYTRVAFWVFAVVAAFYLLMEHRAHLLSWLPYLVVLLCPIMHIFMHRAHGHHDHDTGSRGEEGASSSDTNTHHQ